MAPSTHLRIAYFAVLLDGYNSGAGKKIREQIEAWRNLGQTVELYVITKKADQHAWQEFNGSHVYLERRNILKLLLRFRIMQKIGKTNSEIVYLRDSFPFILPRSTPKLILEVQSNLQAEAFNQGRLKGILAMFLDYFYLKNIHGFIFTSNELSTTGRFRGYTTNAIWTVISNGINLSNHLVLTALSSERKSLFFIGQNGQAWHGVDQIYELARVMTDFDFHLVGIEKPTRLLSRNVYHYGEMESEDFLPIAEKCVVGLGTLNLEVKSMAEASPLKTRLYLALGLPVISRYLDTDFPKGTSFILRIPINDQPITSYENEIRKFCNDWEGKRVPRAEISHLDVFVKEEQRTTFLLRAFQED